MPRPAHVQRQRTRSGYRENPSVSRETTEPLLRSVGQRPTAYRERMATGGRRPKPDHVPTHQGSRRTPDQPSRHPENLPEKAMDCRSIGERKRSRSLQRTKASGSEAILYEGEWKRGRSSRRRAEARPFFTEASGSEAAFDKDEQERCCYPNRYARPRCLMAFPSKHGTP